MPRSAFCWLLLAPALATTVAWAASADRPGASMRARPYDVTALHLDITVDPTSRSVSGTASYTAAPLHQGDFVLDQEGVTTTAITQPDGTPVPFRTEPGRLIVEASPSHLGEDGLLHVNIAFSSTPSTGVHFRSADSGADRFSEVWTQGQRDDHRHWFPAWDHPGDRFDYTGEVHAPEGWLATTNSGHDLPTYLIMFAAGTYEEVVHATDPTTRVWVPPGTSPQAVAQVLDPVPAMKAHFAARTGQEYPWGDYLQVFVQRFLYGGMENTGATINADWALVDPIVVPTRWRVENLIAHELAHQWFGDLVTCRTWRDLWLNEGFATFMAGDWIIESAEAGPEREAVRAWLVRRWFTRSQQQSQPMARRWHHGSGADASNVYNRGAATLWMLQQRVGEEAFWNSVSAYIAKHAHGPVETVDLRRAFEAETGRDLSGFFQQWTELTGSPELTVQHSLKDHKLVVKISAKPMEDGEVAYHIPVEVAARAGGTLFQDTVRLDARNAEVHFDLTTALSAEGAELEWVAVNPNAAVLAQIQHKGRSPQMLARQALTGPPAARFDAIAALADTSEGEALRVIVADEGEPWPYRTAAASALGEQRDADSLSRATDTADPRVRKAIAEALGRCPADKAEDALISLVDRDPSPDVRAAALSSLAEVAPTVALQRARRLTRGQGSTEHFLSTAALEVVGEHGIVADLSLLLDPRLTDRRRNTGLSAAAALLQHIERDRARERGAEQVTERALVLLVDEDLRTRTAAARVLKRVGTPAALPLIELRRRATTVDYEVQVLTEAAEAIRKRADSGVPLAPAEADARLDALEKRLDTLEADVKRLDDRI